MAEFTDRYPLNAPGKYYITGQCLDCDLCRDSAPSNVRRDDRKGISYIFKQPVTPEEIAGLEAGVSGCPTEAVGNDGDKFDWDATPIFDWNAHDPEVQFDIRAPILRTDPPRAWWEFWKKK